MPSMPLRVHCVSAQSLVASSAASTGALAHSGAPVCHPPPGRMHAAHIGNKSGATQTQDVDTGVCLFVHMYLLDVCDGYILVWTILRIYIILYT